MLEDKYSVLGLTPDVSDDELDNVYYKLKAQLEEDRFLDGEAGNVAARKLTELKAAYYEIKEFRKERKNGGAEDLFKLVDEALKAGDLVKAQQYLDCFNERGAEWHYLQSVVFYKKNWMNESKKQLEIAIQMDSANEKYKKALDRLNEKINGERAAFNQNQNGNPNFGGHSGTGNNGYSSFVDNDGAPQMGGSGVCEYCCELCALNMCINIMCSGCCR